jgi:hypothetical protein
MVRPEMVTTAAALVMSKTRLAMTMLEPLIAWVLAPGPVIVMLAVIASSPLVNVIVAPAAAELKVMVLPGLALAWVIQKADVAGRTPTGACIARQVDQQGQRGW